MADEMDRARLLTGISADAQEEELFAAQWKHAADGEALSAAVYLISLADPTQIVGGAGKIKELREASSSSIQH